MAGDWQGKTVFVSGGTSGINLGIALAFARAGARVAVMSRKPEKVEAAVRELRAAGAGDAAGHVADVRDAPAVAQALAAVAAAWGPIDALVSGAAGNFVSPAEALSANGFKSVIDIDLLGTFHVMKAAWPHLRKPGAAVVNISAPQSYVPMPGQVHVCAAKAGIDQVMRTLAMEWGRAGVRINSVSPGPIEGTEGMERLAPNEAAHQAIRRAVPLQRYGTRDDIAQAVMWLCSPAASYVTGALLPVDGGMGLVGAGYFMQLAQGPAQA
ncbi:MULTISPECIES: SDR family oxidoreductase [Ramlibacter]|uniref:SDR family oxidoreductase n=1 Tax=Ramlibacter aquaticus TaxID=2780094 RepID=A0ABR9SDU8_9BURK|nr:MULTISPECIES: SDR family oxidoreductase [Ramlibacter]MBE7940471.1 SDR family oxidoreductase [Ramlibacter aquaticus]